MASILRLCVRYVSQLESVCAEGQVGGEAPGFSHGQLQCYAATLKVQDLSVDLKLSVSFPLSIYPSIFLSFFLSIFTSFYLSFFRPFLLLYLTSTFFCSLLWFCPDNVYIFMRGRGGSYYCNSNTLIKSAFFSNQGDEISIFSLFPNPIHHYPIFLI